MKLKFELHVYTWYEPIGGFASHRDLVPLISTAKNGSYPNMLTYVDKNLAADHDRDEYYSTWKSYPRLKKL